MRIFAAGLATETNTFAPFPAGRLAFEEAGVFRGNGSEGDSLFSPVMKAWKEGARDSNTEFAEGFLSFAQPAGTTPRPVYEGYRDEILADLKARGPFDIVLLALHGAMVAEGYDDCEGDLITRIRALSPPDVVIGAVLDPHTHLTPAMMTADVLIAAKEYPHTDFVARAQEVLKICLAARKREVKPVQASFDCNMVGFYPTTQEPMRGLVEQLRALEQQPGILSASIVHGFPWADVASVGTRVLVVADGDSALAAAKAAEMGQAIYAQRETLLPKFPPLDEALDQALALPGRVVIADVADNAGGGAPADNTAMLREMIRRKVEHAACGLFWDPIAARICFDAGIGARLPLRLGGKCGVTSDDPLDLIVTVRGLREDHQQSVFGSTVPLGLSVWIEAEEIDIVIISIRHQTFSPDAFTGLGIDLDNKRLVAVKSSQHFQAGFRPIADAIIQAGTRGTMEMDFAQMPYTKRDPGYFPRVPAPLGG